MRNILKDRRFFVFKAGIFGFASVLFVLLCVFSCNNLLTLSEGGSLLVSVPGGRNASDATIYTIELNGTTGSVYRKTIAAGETAAFEELVPDTYTILVKGSNEEDIVVYYGSSSATVEAGKTASAMVELMALLGGLTVEFSGTAATSHGKNFSIDLRGSRGYLYTKTFTAGEIAQFERLIPDLYTIDVHGTNEKNAVIYHGVNTATVEVGKKTTVLVDMVAEATDFASLKEAIAAGGTVYVLNDIPVTESLTINQDVTIRALDKDVTLNLASDSEDSMFEVGSGGELTLGGGEYMLTVNGNKMNRSSSLLNIDGGKVHLYGTITNSYSPEKTGIEIGNSSSFYMYDGATVSNCECIDNYCRGGAIAVRSGGEMYMYGGTITGNRCYCAAAIYVDSDRSNMSGGTFNMSGGTITGNTATSPSNADPDRPSAVEISEYGKFTQTGGSITGNSPENIVNKSTLQ